MVLTLFIVSLFLFTVVIAGLCTLSYSMPWWWTLWWPRRESRSSQRLTQLGHRWNTLMNSLQSCSHSHIMESWFCNNLGFFNIDKKKTGIFKGTTIRNWKGPGKLQENKNTWYFVILCLLGNALLELSGSISNYLHNDAGDGGGNRFIVMYY